METQEKYLTDMESKQLQIINYYGVDHQLNKLAEECAELIQAILKNEDIFKGNIINEMADVLNLMEQIQLKDEFIKEGINIVRDFKVNRELNKIYKSNKEVWKFALE